MEPNMSHFVCYSRDHDVTVSPLIMDETNLAPVSSLGLSGCSRSLLGIQRGLVHCAAQINVDKLIATGPPVIWVPKRCHRSEVFVAVAGFHDMRYESDDSTVDHVATSAGGLKLVDAASKTLEFQADLSETYIAWRDAGELQLNFEFFYLLGVRCFPVEMLAAVYFRWREEEFAEIVNASYLWTKEHPCLYNENYVCAYPGESSLNKNG